MGKKANERKLRQMIFSGMADITDSEIKRLIDNELSKDDKDVDMDYIDLCFELMEARKNNAPAKKKQGFTYRRALIAAIVVILFVATGITASASAVRNNIPKILADFVTYNAGGANTSADGYALSDTELSKKLAELGIAPVTFPEEILGEDCRITDIRSVTEDETNSANVTIDFEYKAMSGELTVLLFAQNAEWTGTNNSRRVISAQVIPVNGMGILVLEQEDGCLISYKDNLTVYYIELNCDMDTAIEFADSIK